jgi:succinate dehydrogenase / fumarate reductase, flavoprotein subunit
MAWKREDAVMVTGHDVIIVGAGAAGVRTAIELKRHGLRPLVLGKRRHGDAHTVCAAGGINAALGTLDPEDRWQIHAADTLLEGHFINDPRAVEIVCKAAPKAVQELKEWGCPFETTDDGRITQRYFGAQSFRRTCFVGDTTGRAILRTLVDKAREMEVEYREGIHVLKVLLSEGRVAGVLALDLATGRFTCFNAPVVVLAAGGHANIYRTSSSRAGENTGDGAALAYEAGATLMDMELIQFHPTGMVRPEEWRGELVTEAVRGEGGRLYNARKERFMEKYSPDKMELDARDEVARAIAFELAAGRGTEAGGVYLDISHEDPEKVKERLPDMVQRFHELGIDITKEVMEVGPTSHYSMGGVKVDFETGATGVAGLYAVGETTAGLHGANRLGGNSLIETIVLGEITGRHLAAHRPGPGTPVPESEVKRIVDELMARPLAKHPDQVIKRARNIMEDHAGIVRSHAGLKKGLDALVKLRGSMESEAAKDPTQFAAAMELEMMLLVDEILLRCALMREESRGAHYREDHKEPRDEWRCNILCRKGAGGMEFSTSKPAGISQEIQNAIDEGHSLDHHLLE